MQRKEEILSRLDELLTAELPDAGGGFDFDDDLLPGLSRAGRGGDDLTPATLLREHGSLWATRRGEDDMGLEDPDAFALSEAWELESPRRRQLH
ncbi:hypothetical protein C3942_19740 [Solimonas fluminis]|uniref:Uncharacterized protein n=1 Tax=Solimonas fluminis TaxID=2086571 RepID=A0A2S5TAV3_9GAMM|nr:hypothetical protein [Solimonas fluminis]PPE72133.1 hypothetical protein C3942_19740 [Solimonas fluminis]